jgi:DNA processing protein
VTPALVDVAAPAAVRMLAIDDADYPPRLRDLEHPPRCIWALGNLDIASRPVAVAIVGTRNATEYGERVTRDIAAAFARAGAVVVSGMARGIDGAAHRGALDVGGETIAVLGTGVDVSYPARHRPMHREIVSKGLVVSEMPPGARAHRGSFVERNRLIAALGLATIVVEAGSSSGALKTADYADGIGRVVAGVPGRIDSVQSAGVNQLIKTGANVVGSVDDALALVGLSRAVASAPSFESDAERRIWDALARPALQMDLLASAAGLPARSCMEAVTSLELKGLVECCLTGEIRRRG